MSGGLGETVVCFWYTFWCWVIESLLDSGTFGAQSPVFEIDGRVIGGGKAGPIFHRIRQLYKDKIKKNIVG